MTAAPVPAVLVAEHPVRALARRWGKTVALGVVALFSLLVFGFGTDAGTSTTFSLSRREDTVQLPVISVPAQVTAIVLSLVLFAIVFAMVVLMRRGVKPHWGLSVGYGIAVVAALLTWVGAGRDATNVPITSILVFGVGLSVPLVFGAMAGTLCERSGVVNIAIEGQLLAGAFLAVVVGSATGNAYIGMAVAPIAGALVGALLALFAVRYWVDQIVVGVVLNVLVIGLTSFLLKTLLEDNPQFNESGAALTAAGGIAMNPLPIPLLSDIPILGPILFDQTALVYVMYVIVIVFQIMLFKSRWGLRVRAVGEHPKAADTVGIRVNRTRVRNTILGGAIAGLGGAYFTVASRIEFESEMTAGKGYIALAAMILGRWKPTGALLAALLFGTADALGQQFGIIGSSIPSEFVAMLPYVATILAVAGLVGKARPPAAENIPYKK